MAFVRAHDNCLTALAGGNSEDEILSFRGLQISHLVNLTRVHDDCISGAQDTTFGRDLHFHFPGQQNEDFLHILVKVSLEGRMAGQDSPVQHLHVALLERIAGGDDPFEHTGGTGVFV